MKILRSLDRRNPPTMRRIVFVLDRSGSMTSPRSDSVDSPRTLANQSLSESGFRDAQFRASLRYACIRLKIQVA